MNIEEPLTKESPFGNSHPLDLAGRCLELVFFFVLLQVVGYPTLQRIQPCFAVALLATCVRLDLRLVARNRTPESGGCPFGFPLDLRCPVGFPTATTRLKEHPQQKTHRHRVSVFALGTAHGEFCAAYLRVFQTTAQLVS